MSAIVIKLVLVHDEILSLKIKKKKNDLKEVQSIKISNHEIWIYRQKLKTEHMPLSENAYMNRLIGFEKI